MRVTFVHLGRENLGIEYLSSLLEVAGHQTSLACDLGLFGPEDNVLYSPFLEKLFGQKQKVIKEIEKSSPDLVCFSAYTSNYIWLCDVAKAIKKKLGVKIVFGGVHTTLVPELVIKNDFIDFVIQGEAEFALLELVERLASKGSIFNIDNLIFKKDGQVIKNKLRPLVSDLDLLPLPNKELFRKHINYQDDYMIMTGRGCVFSCSYCGESFINQLYENKFYRKRSVGTVINELVVMKRRYHFKEVMFLESLFFTDKEWLSNFLERYKSEIGVPFKCLGSVLYFDQQVGQMLKDAGCYCIDFGLQTVNEQLKRNVLNRFETNKKAEQVFRICDQLKLRYDIDHMFGLPGESLGDHIKGAKFYSRFKYINRIKCFELTYFPKIEIINSAQEKGLLSEQQIKDIEEGRIGDFFHKNSFDNQKMDKINKSFKNFYKILPLFSTAVVQFILKYKIYHIFRFIPSLLVIFLQVLVAIRGRDYRYWFYFKYYLLRIRRGLMHFWRC